MVGIVLSIVGGFDSLIALANILHFLIERWRAITHAVWQIPLDLIGWHIHLPEAASRLLTACTFVAITASAIPRRTWTTFFGADQTPSPANAVPLMRKKKWWWWWERLKSLSNMISNAILSQFVYIPVFIWLFCLWVFGAARRQGVKWQGFTAALLLTALISVMIHEYFAWLISHLAANGSNAPIIVMFDITLALLPIAVCFTVFLVGASASIAFRTRMWTVISLVGIAVTLGYSAPHIAYLKDFVIGTLR